MANNYRIIDEAAWERAMHCAVFRNCVEPAFCVTFEAEYDGGRICDKVKYVFLYFTFIK